MAFKSFERSHLELSVLAILSSLTTSYASAQVTEPASPATAEACVALASSADRLACYDSLFKAPTVIQAQPQVSEPVIAASPAVAKIENQQSQPESLKEKLFKGE